MLIRTDCRYYCGDRPCKYHKKGNAKCSSCSYYKKLKKRILIIKLGSLGDVIRTTPLLRRLIKVFPYSEISWLTYFPEALSHNYVDNILEANLENIIWLGSNSFDWLINLDKDRYAITLTKLIKARKKSGFGMDKFGKCAPLNSKEAKGKWLTGINDDLSRQNSKNYLEEIFGICGFKFQKEEYIVECEPENHCNWPIDLTRRVVGLNTGSSPLWRARLWPQEYWIGLAKKLKSEGYEVILLGGKQEHEINTKITNLSGAKYFGNFGLTTFIDLVNQCELVVTSVTMCLHLALGLKKKVIALNSTFNKNEFFLYNRGIILEPGIKCDCYYADSCPNRCMESLNVEKVYENIQKLISLDIPF